MAEITKLNQITTAPGIRRDGTNLDSDFYTAGQWVSLRRWAVIVKYPMRSADLLGPCWCGHVGC